MLIFCLDVLFTFTYKELIIHSLPGNITNGFSQHLSLTCRMDGNGRIKETNILNMIKVGMTYENSLYSRILNIIRLNIFSEPIIRCFSER